MFSEYKGEKAGNIGDHPFQPKVLLVAPTGIAASLIGKCYDEILLSAF